MRRLMLMRHAKSDWGAAFSSDHERPLNERGRTAAQAMGMVIRNMAEVPDRVISSTAVRARSTAELARIAGGWPCPLELDERLYGTGPEEALVVAADYGGDEERIMLVGHEPSWSQLISELTGARAQVKTATVAAIDLERESWMGAARTPGSLAFIVHPRLFTDGEWEL
jgi:phosphohistidine phosphatase